MQGREAGRPQESRRTAVHEGVLPTAMVGVLEGSETETEIGVCISTRISLGGGPVGRKEGERLREIVATDIISLIVLLEGRINVLHFQLYLWRRLGLPAAYLEIFIAEIAVVAVQPREVQLAIP